jgi:S-formylglutathione hydrolase
MADLTTLSEHRCFDGTVSFHEHHSASSDAIMRFAVYVRQQAAEGPVSALYDLTGLTSTEANFIEKGGAQRYAAEHGLLLAAPDPPLEQAGCP